MNMFRRVVRFAWKPALVVLVIIAAMSVIRPLWKQHSKIAAAAFFSRALMMNDVIERVTVSGRSYTVTRGIVTQDDGTEVTGIDALEQLTTAYAAATARRSPLFGIGGTNVTKFKNGIDKLHDVTQNIAAFQKSPAERKRVAEDLYPFSFLYSLVNLENARKDFIDAPSDERERIYDNALAKTISAAQTDIRAFESAYEATDKRSYSVSYGVITPESIRRNISSIKIGFSNVSDTFQRRNECIAGRTRSCDLNDIAIPLITETASTTPVSTTVPENVLSVMKLRQGSGDAKIFGGRLVVLDKSECINDVQGPVYFVLKNINDSGTYPALEYVGDLFFMALDKNASGIFADKDVAYLLYTPTSYYNCPGSARDVARAEMVWEADRVYTRVAGMPTSTISIESNLAARIKALYPTIESLNQRNSLIGELERLRDNTAGLQDIVNEIAVFNQRDLDTRDAGFGDDFPSDFLFPVRSDFYALFLTANATAGLGSLDPFDHDVKEIPQLPLTRWSSISKTVPASKIMHDMSVYFRYHTAPQTLTDHAKK